MELDNFWDEFKMNEFLKMPITGLKTFSQCWLRGKKKSIGSPTKGGWKSRALKIITVQIKWIQFSFWLRINYWLRNEENGTQPPRAAHSTILSLKRNECTWLNRNRSRRPIHMKAISKATTNNSRSMKNKMLNDTKTISGRTAII